MSIAIYLVRISNYSLDNSGFVKESDRRFHTIRNTSKMKKATLKDATINGAVGRSSL